MNIFFLTQPDAFYIPRLLDRFMEEKPEPACVVGAAILKGEIAIENICDYTRLLGARGVLLNGLEFARYKVLDLLDRFVKLEEMYSVEGVLREYDIPEHTPKDVNDATFHRLLRELDVDLVISIACPQIVREELLTLPPKGVINLHGALLPKYRGKLPSFWVLANGEKKTGVTVHYMNEKLDDGPIIVQHEVPIEPDDSLHSLVLKSKVRYGAPALAEAVRLIMNGEVTIRKNDGAEATYFSFPDKEAIEAFRRQGRKVR